MNSLPNTDLNAQLALALEALTEALARLRESCLVMHWHLCQVCQAPRTFLPPYEAPLLRAGERRERFYH